ncbi:MAG: class I SAM-dependent methyltransferase [Acidobacteria bacterium]|nr:class I SAM-dependent methyltransferase [Acidobacteriota bacterium]
MGSSRDLSQNSARNAVENARREGVADRVEFVSQGARRLDFSDESFDVVLSNLCLHNIRSTADRARACFEMARAARRGGTVVVSDFQKTAEYVRALSEAGLQVTRSRPFLFDTFPPLRMVTARKP